MVYVDGDAFPLDIACLGPCLFALWGAVHDAETHEHLTADMVDNCLDMCKTILDPVVKAELSGNVARACQITRERITALCTAAADKEHTVARSWLLV